MPTAKTSSPPPCSDESVLKATGKKWKQWYAVLAKEKAKDLAHPQIAKLLETKYGCSLWWSQQVTVGYERHIGRRAAHESKAGFTANVSKTFPLTVEKAKQLFSEEVRPSWLTMKLTLRSKPGSKALRFQGPNESMVEIVFTAKTADKCVVAVQHSKLADDAERQKLKGKWKKALDGL